MNKSVDLNQKLLKATDIAEILNVSRAMAYQLMQQEKIRSVRIGTARRVRCEDLSAFIERNLSSLQE